MNTSGEAADQVVRMSLEVGEMHKRSTRSIVTRNLRRIS